MTLKCMKVNSPQPFNENATPNMPTARTLLPALIVWNLLTNCLLAAPPDEDDEEFRPGLVAEYRVGERAVTRIDPDVAFAWDEAAPDARLSAERFEATWRGLVLIRLEAKHRLHAFVQGEVTVELDGRRVLHGSAKQPQWISGDEFVPGFAERPLVVTFRKTEPAAQLKLFWSSDSFGLEPLPPELLFYDPSRLGLRPDPAAERKNPDQTQGRDGVPTYALIERGRQQFAAFRCGRCHVRESDSLAPAAPSLQHVAAGMTAEQIAKRLAPAMNTSDATAPDRRMPHFRLNDQQAQHLAAFLVKQSESVKLDEAKTIKPKTPKEGEPVVTSQRRGELLLRSVGCLACHRVGELGNSNDLPFTGPDLTHVRQRRPASWLTTWLADPQRLNADHRMPVFESTDEERHLIVMALTTMPLNNEGAGHSLRSESSDPTKVSGAISGSKRIRPKSASNIPTNDKPDDSPQESPVDAGRRLFVEHRCAACHRTTDPKLAEFARPKNDLSRPTDWSQGCLDEQWVNDSQKHPIYLRGLDRAAIKAFLSSRWNVKLSSDSQFVRGTRMLEEKNCFACHPRHGGIGLGRTAKLVAAVDKELNGQAPSLVAPSLNSIGDKLLDEALSIAVRGERQPIRMPWLKVRMPKFKHLPDELATLTRYFVEHDRIPLREERRRGGVEERSKTGQSDPTSSPQTHLAGQALTGVRGWSCIACHKISDYEPKQVALGARGSDLRLLGKHIRPEFFFRWIASPLRVIPGVEMPQYNRPVAGVLDGDLSKQHAALWQALNDPNFQPPTNPNNVEQFFVVNPGEQPRIIRDVFSISKELGGGTVPRSFAVGFDNGHSFLFNLETASLRQWTFGDFARQQAIGKRWLWEMAGLPLGNFAAETEIRLWTSGDSPSKAIPIRTARGLQYGTQAGRDELVFGYTREFDAERILEIQETLKSIRPASDASDPAGIDREMIITRHQWEGDDELELRVRIPKPLAASPVAKIDLTDVAIQDNYISETSIWKTVRWKDVEKDGWLRIKLQPHAGVRLRVSYTANLQRPATSVVVKPIVRAERLRVASVPGFEGWQLPIDASIMPTALTWSPRGALAFTSLKGHVFVARDGDGDGLEDDLRMIQEGLAAPYGIMAYPTSHSDADGEVDEFLVAHKPDVLHLIDRKIKNSASISERHTLAEGWGYNADYHDWTCGIVRDSQGRFLFGLGSDYTDKNRPADEGRWRGKVLRLDTEAWLKRKVPPREVEIGPVSVISVTAQAHAFRYPTGLAINERDEVFVSDQQGVQNCFNEINYLVEGAHYGVPSTHEEDKDAPETKAAIQIPHPWTRSVNGLVFLTGKEGYPDLKGHGIGCEYNGRFLIRFSTQRVGDVMQGAVYPFSMTDDELVRGIDNAGPPPGATFAIEVSGGKPAAPRQKTIPNFEGPLCCGVSPKGEIYIGSIADSGWAGGQNTGSIVKLKGNGQRPNGIREIRATRDGFDIDFFAPVDRARATNPEHYSISGYTRVWGGAYATPDSDRHRCKVLSIELSDDNKTAKLKVDSRKTPNYVYDISCREVADPDKPFFPAYGFFTLHRTPTE